ncbi:hypothetical protein [Mycobacterium spongiae]|uniref:Uncharacterized protein n=1 Tax=Mycobacterium spongiae TaxID=886343 RepID=A0A975PX96_9MYCO|nr:hypothetical protein [Mycobacterium spongiae]QUR67513.1 hypothetical protein F6B93_10765 [Mycobacterium spongiae]
MGEAAKLALVTDIRIGRRHRTTIHAEDARRGPDLLDRDFKALMIDCYSRAIVG